MAAFFKVHYATHDSIALYSRQRFNNIPSFYSDAHGKLTKYSSSVPVVIIMMPETRQRRFDLLLFIWFLQVRLKSALISALLHQSWDCSVNLSPWTQLTA